MPTVLNNNHCETLLKYAMQHHQTYMKEVRNRKIDKWKIAKQNRDKVHDIYLNKTKHVN